MITQSRLKELLNYNSDTGVFTWIKRSGSVAGGLDKCGYIHIRVDYNLYFAHRLAWLYVYGLFPEDQIDHINRVKDDNRFTNLRPATKSQNQMNTPRRSDNKSGHKGVCWSKTAKKWNSGIRVDGKRKHLGSFNDKSDAILAYNSAADKYYGKFANYGVTA
jgi:hypothetical protein